MPRADPSAERGKRLRKEKGATCGVETRDLAILASAATDPGAFFVKDGYRENPRPIPYDDSEEEASIYQVDVYRFAAQVLREERLQNVLDVGCGLGVKLEQHILPLCGDITGIDGAHAIRYCRQKHRFGSWYEDDIDAPELAWQRAFDLVISVDVVEHLINPDTLLALMRKVTHARSLLVLSTPERDVLRGPDHLGPPPNPSHVREWNRSEFAAYLTSRGIDILAHSLMNHTEQMLGTCQTVLGRFSPH